MDGDKLTLFHRELEKYSPQMRRSKWQPTPVLLPRESYGQRSLVGCCLLSRTESDTTEVTACMYALVKCCLLGKLMWPRNPYLLLEMHYVDTLYLICTKFETPRGKQVLRRKWQPTPVFLPGESQGQGSLVGCCLWGCTESDTTEVN